MLVYSQDIRYIECTDWGKESFQVTHWVVRWSQSWSALVPCLDHGPMFLQLIKNGSRPVKACPISIAQVLCWNLIFDRIFIETMFKIVKEISIISYKWRWRRHIENTQNIITIPSLLFQLLTLFCRFLLISEIAVDNLSLTKRGTLSAHLNQGNYFHHVLLIHILCISFLLDYLPQI